MIVGDETTERTRKLYIDDSIDSVFDKCRNMSAYQNHTKYSGHHYCITFSTENFLQSVDVILSRHPDSEDRDIEEYFNGNFDTTDQFTAVILHPYIERPDLSEKTNRDYIDEMDSCVDYLKNNF